MKITYHCKRMFQSELSECFNIYCPNCREKIEMVCDSKFISESAKNIKEDFQKSIIHERPKPTSIAPKSRPKNKKLKEVK